MTELDYARPRARADRLMRFVLLFMQVNAMFVFLGSFALFWITVAQVGIEVVQTGSFDDDFVRSFTYSTHPMMLATIAWATCGILRRMLT
jgi:hypothetical protein